MTKMKKMNLQENHPVAKERAQGRGRAACSFTVMITFNITHSKYMCITSVHVHTDLPYIQREYSCLRLITKPYYYAFRFL